MFISVFLSVILEVSQYRQRTKYVFRPIHVDCLLLSQLYSEIVKIKMISAVKSKLFHYFEQLCILVLNKYKAV